MSIESPPVALRLQNIQALRGIAALLVAFSGNSRSLIRCAGELISCGGTAGGHCGVHGHVLVSVAGIRAASFSVRGVNRSSGILLAALALKLFFDVQDTLRNDFGFLFSYAGRYEIQPESCGGCSGELRGGAGRSYLTRCTPRRPRLRPPPAGVASCFSSASSTSASRGATRPPGSDTSSASSLS